MRAAFTTLVVASWGDRVPPTRLVTTVPPANFHPQGWQLQGLGRRPASFQGPRPLTHGCGGGGLRAEGRAHHGPCQIDAWWWEMPLTSWARTSETRLAPGAQTWRVQPEPGVAPVCTHQPLTASPVAPGTAQDPHQPLPHPARKPWVEHLASNPAVIYGSQR